MCITLMLLAYEQRFVEKSEYTALLECLPREISRFTNFYFNYVQWYLESI